MFRPPSVKPPTAEESREQLKTVLERFFYVMRWLADTPHHLIDGQHHQALADAVSHLDARLKELPGGWDGLFRGPHPGYLYERFEEHGLAGAEWALKYAAFDRRYRSFLDRVAIVEARESALATRLDELETRDFVSRLKKDATGSLAMGATIAESAAEAVSEIPGAKVLLGSLKEAAGALTALLQD